MRKRLSDRYWESFPFLESLIDLRIWREDHFRWYYRRKRIRLHRKNMMEKFGFVPGPGDWIEDCRPEVHQITSVDSRDPDEVTVDDGWTFSLWHCCSLPRKNHPVKDEA